GLAPYATRILLDSASSFALPVHQTEYEEAGLNENHQFGVLYENIPPGRYIVEVADSLGCSIQLTGRVPLDKAIFIPNVFSPNGDGKNDVFFIRNLPLESTKNSLVITNRWGKEVYVSEDYKND